MITNAIVQNAGQTCSAGSRVLVQRSIYDALHGHACRALRPAQGRPARPRPRLRPGDHRQAEAAGRGLPRAQRPTTTSPPSPPAPSIRVRRTGRLLRAADALHARAGGQSAGPGGGVRPGAGGDPLRRRGATPCASPTAPTTAWSPASGRRTGRARCAWPRACAPARCSSTATAPAAASSCPSAASSRSGHGREKGLEALREFTVAKTVVFNHG